MCAVQLAKALGAKVIGAASPGKLSVVKEHGGADHVVDYTKDGWQKEVLKITGGKGVDVVYDPVGKIKGTCKSMSPHTALNPGTDSLKCIAWSGRALVIGFAGGAIEKVCSNPVYISLLLTEAVLASFEPRTSQECLRRRCALGFIHAYVHDVCLRRSRLTYPKTRTLPG